LFEPHPNWAPELNQAHAESELQGGCDLNKLPVGGKVVAQTKNTKYEIEKLEDGFLIQGNATYCPIPTKGNIVGSLYARESSMIRTKFIGRGMFMEFTTVNHPQRIVTSQIVEVTEI
jgi:hypothetical protein